MMQAVHVFYMPLSRLAPNYANRVPQCREFLTTICASGIFGAILPERTRGFRQKCLLFRS